MHVLLVGAGILVVLVGTLIDYEALGDFAIPLWVYLAAHLAIIAGFFKRGSLRRLLFAAPVLLLTIPMVCLAMSSLGHHLYRIKPGMTVAQARRIMAGFKEGTGLTSPYTGEEFVPAGCLIFRDRRHPESHRAWGTVIIHDGRLTDVFVSPD